MKVKTLADAKKAARLHGLDSDPEHETGDLIDMLDIVWRYVPKDKKAEVLAKLDAYVEDTCCVEHYSQSFDVRHHPCHPDYDGD